MNSPAKRSASASIEVLKWAWLKCVLRPSCLNNVVLSATHIESSHAHTADCYHAYIVWHSAAYCSVSKDTRWMRMKMERPTVLPLMRPGIGRNHIGQELGELLI